MRLKGKTAVITGGTRGIGLACAELFAKEGAEVIVCGIQKTPEIPANVEFYALDVTDRPGCKTFFDHAIEKHGSIDILINNAGITQDAMTRRMTDEQWDSVVSVNLSGVFNLTRYIGPHMSEKKSGAIVNISSVVGEGGNIGQANYAATKAALIGLTKTWAKEFALKGANVRVNAIAPGSIMTDMLKNVPQDMLDKIVAGVPLGRVGEPIDVANAALFLSCDDSAYITGHVLSVNGGLYI